MENKNDDTYYNEAIIMDNALHEIINICFLIQGSKDAEVVYSLVNVIKTRAENTLDKAGGRL